MAGQLDAVCDMVESILELHSNCWCMKRTPREEDDHLNVTVVIDAFRAFATAAYILHQRPREYSLTSTSASAGRLAAADPDALLVGEAGNGRAGRV